MSAASTVGGTSGPPAWSVSVVPTIVWSPQGITNMTRPSATARSTIAAE